MDSESSMTKDGEAVEGGVWARGFATALQAAWRAGRQAGWSGAPRDLAGGRAQDGDQESLLQPCQL